MPKRKPTGLGKVTGVVVLLVLIFIVSSLVNAEDIYEFNISIPLNFTSIEDFDNSTESGTAVYENNYTLDTASFILNLIKKDNISNFYHYSNSSIKKIYSDNLGWIATTLIAEDRCWVGTLSGNIMEFNQNYLHNDTLEGVNLNFIAESDNTSIVVVYTAHEIDGGVFNVTLDGNFIGSVDTSHLLYYCEDTYNRKWENRREYVVNDISSGSHNITIRNTNTNKKIYFDGIFFKKNYDNITKVVVDINESEIYSGSYNNLSINNLEIRVVNETLESLRNNKSISIRVKVATNGNVDFRSNISVKQNKTLREIISKLKPLPTALPLPASSGLGGGGAPAPAPIQPPPAVVLVVKYLPINAKEITEINAGESKVVTFDQSPVKSVEISVSNFVSNTYVQITQLKAENKTENKTKTFIEFELEIPNITIKEIAITFEVEKSWIEENNINKSTIKLRHFKGGGHVDENTTQVSEDTENLTYTAKITSLSKFAIVGQQNEEVGIIFTPTPTEKSSISEINGVEMERIGMNLLIFGFLLVSALGIFLVWIRGKRG